MNPDRQGAVPENARLKGNECELRDERSEDARPEGNPPDRSESTRLEGNESERRDQRPENARPEGNPPDRPENARPKNNPPDYPENARSEGNDSERRDERSKNARPENNPPDRPESTRSEENDSERRDERSEDALPMGMNPDPRRSLPEALRAILRPILPCRAFLRRARSGAAFVTDAPRHLGEGENPALLARLESSGFLWREQNGLLFLSPGPRILTAFEDAHPDPPDFLCATLARFRGRAPCPQALALFADGVRLLERADPGERRDYERRTRQLAALCLRKNLGGICACALIAAQLDSDPS